MRRAVLALLLIAPSTAFGKDLSQPWAVGYNTGFPHINALSGRSVLPAATPAI